MVITNTKVKMGREGRIIRFISSPFVSLLKSKPQFTKEQNQEVIRWGFVVLVSDHKPNGALQKVVYHI